MQPPRGSGTTELTRSSGAAGGLARYRSAPATWLEALLESDDDQSEVVLDIPKPPSTAAPSDLDLDFLESTSAAGLTNFLRQNSSPAEFLSLLNDSDGYFSNLGIPATYDYVSSSSAKRAREAEDLDNLSPKLSSSSSTPLKGEKGGQLQGGTGGSLDAEMEKLLGDSVMCRVRAKRGCATHPRSIAERVRRTRISDRIRKLQELVPNMDKQTNTADMLDEAVAYVKFLQKQIQRSAIQHVFAENILSKNEELMVSNKGSQIRGFHDMEECFPQVDREKIWRRNDRFCCLAKELTEHQRNCKCIIND